MSRDSLPLSSSVSLLLMLCEVSQLVAVIPSQHIRLTQHRNDWKEKKETRAVTAKLLHGKEDQFHYQNVFTKRGKGKKKKNRELRCDRHWLLCENKALLYWSILLWEFLEKKEAAAAVIPDSWFHPLLCVGEKNTGPLLHWVLVFHASHREFSEMSRKPRKWEALFDKVALFLILEKKKWERGVKQRERERELVKGRKRGGGISKRKKRKEKREIWTARGRGL